MKKTIQQFYDELSKLCYWSMVENYEYNKFNEIRKKYGIKKKCSECGKEINLEEI